MARREIKAQKAEVAGVQLAADVASDQVAGNDKKYIDSGKSAGGSRYTRMIEHHAENGDRAESIDVGAYNPLVWPDWVMLFNHDCKWIQARALPGVLPCQRRRRKFIKYDKLLL